jgi:ComF family protein
MVPAKLIDDFLHVLFPELCFTCGEKLLTGEEHVCLTCYNDLPFTDYHSIDNNPVKRLFDGRLMLDRAGSLLLFDKGGKVQSLIHEMKYQGHGYLGAWFGRLYAERLKKDGIAERFDLVTCVPLHPKKEKQRGYNQSVFFAKGLSESLAIPFYSKMLVRNTYTSSQTRKGRMERWNNVEKVFEMKQVDLAKQKHVLLVDDVVTTGATLEACGQELLNNGATQVSIATIAYSGTV